MKRIMNHFVSPSSSWRKAFGLVFLGAMALSSCKQDLYENQPKPEETTDDGGTPAVVTNAGRVAYAEKVLGVTIDKEQDWSLTEEYSITIKADADLDNHTGEVRGRAGRPLHCRRPHDGLRGRRVPGRAIHT